MIAILRVVGRLPPVAWLRRALRRIDYYSAHRERTGWRRAIEWALPITAILAVPAMLLAEASAMREATIASVHGEIVLGPDGSFGARTVREGERPRFEGGAPWGEFDALLVNELRGWPVVSHVAIRRLRYDVRVFDEADPRLDIDFAIDDPLHAAIDGALVAEGRTDLLAGGFERGWFSWERLAGGMVWWVALFIVTSASIRVVQFAARYTAGRRVTAAARRLAHGRCGRCGYDLRGIEFSARCPECGDLL